MSTCWADMAENSPPRDVPSGSGEGDIGSPDVERALLEVHKCEAAIVALGSQASDSYDKTSRLRLEKELASLLEGYEAVKAASQATKAAISTPPLPEMPILNLDKSTDQKIMAVYDHIVAYCDRRIDGNVRQPISTNTNADRLIGRGQWSRPERTFG